MDGKGKLCHTATNFVLILSLLGIFAYFSWNSIVKYQNGAKDFTETLKIQEELDSPTFVFCMRPNHKESLIEKYGLDDGYFTIYGDSKSIMIKILMASNSKIF